MTKNIGTLEACKEAFERSVANLTFDWKSMDKDELIKLYIKNRETKDSDYYLSAIILRYWRSINYAKRSYSTFTDEECLDCYLDSIEKALTYGINHMDAIKNEDHPYNMVMNRCIQNVFENYRVTQTRDIRKINHSPELVSMDDDRFYESARLVTSDKYNSKSYGSESLVKSFVDTNTVDSYVNAIILDRIAYGDSMSDNKFSRYELAQTLAALEPNFKNYFIKKYDADTTKLAVSLDQIKALTSKKYNNGKAFNKKLYQKVDALLTGLSNRSEVKEYLC